MLNQLVRGAAMFSKDGTAPVFVSAVDTIYPLSPADGGRRELHPGGGQLTRLSILQVLLGMMDARGCGTWGHGQRVARYSLATALQMGLGSSEIEGLYYGALLHDAGKLCLSDSVLNRPGPFDPTDWHQMKGHPQLGYRILRGTLFLESALPVVLYHHERYDGTGYPFHLKRRQIPRLGRICAIADAYDAMTTERPYRDRWDPELAAQEILSCRGTQFDPDIAEAFLAARQAGFPLGEMSSWSGLSDASCPRPFGPRPGEI